MWRRAHCGRGGRRCGVRDEQSGDDGGGRKRRRKFAGQEREAHGYRVIDGMCELSNLIDPYRRFGRMALVAR